MMLGLLHCSLYVKVNPNHILAISKERTRRKTINDKKNSNNNDLSNSTVYVTIRYFLLFDRLEFLALFTTVADFCSFNCSRSE